MTKLTKTEITQTQKHLNGKFDEYIAILKEMVAINTFSENAMGINQLSDYTEKLFAKLQFKAEYVQSDQLKSGKHLLLTRKGLTEKSIICITHLDTVFTAEEEKNNSFCWRIEQNKIYGPGTQDIKGGTLCIYMMLEALSEVFPDLFNNITWKVYCDATEETKSDDFGNLCKQAVQAQNENTLGCLVFESGELDGFTHKLVTARKGRNVIKIAAKGKSAHSGSEHANGANAILHLCDVLIEAQKVNDYSKELTVNVGLVTGGTVLNRIPDQAAAVIEMRAFDNNIMQEGLKKISELTNLQGRGSVDKKYICTTQVEFERDVPAWPQNKGSVKLFEIWQEAGKILGVDVLSEKRGGISDGNWIAEIVPTIDGLGPAGGNCHCCEFGNDGSQQEYINSDSLIPKTMLNVLAVYTLCQ
jgi:glutamate carboxypeptidase